MHIRAQAWSGLLHLLLDERQSLIRERLHQDSRVISVELARELGVSEDTIRRDLREMAARGECLRVYGGALPTGRGNITLTQRAREASVAKNRLASRALHLLFDGAVIFLDASSTNLALAKSLSVDMQLTCITNAPQIAACIVEHPNCQLIVIGGLIDPVIGASVGAQALREAENFGPDICFLGACAVDASAGVTAFHTEDAVFKRAVMASSAQTVVLVTNDKLGKAAPYRVAGLDQIGMIFVEDDAPEAALGALRKAEAVIMRADNNQPALDATGGRGVLEG
jgi:DeoR/GlpR family transcriptional regulator of sugar metabolism